MLRETLFEAVDAVFTEPKSSAVGLTVNREELGVVPDRATVCGDPALLAMLSAAERLPLVLAVGVKVTETVVLPLEGTVMGNVVGVKAKSAAFAPDKVMPVT